MQRKYIYLSCLVVALVVIGVVVGVVMSQKKSGGGTPNPKDMMLGCLTNSQAHDVFKTSVDTDNLDRSVCNDYAIQYNSKTYGMAMMQGDTPGKMKVRCYLNQTKDAKFEPPETCMKDQDLSDKVFCLKTVTYL